MVSTDPDSAQTQLVGFRPYSAPIPSQPHDEVHTLMQSMTRPQPLLMPRRGPMTRRGSLLAAASQFNISLQDTVSDRLRRTHSSEQDAAVAPVAAAPAPESLLPSSRDPPVLPLDVSQGSEAAPLAALQQLDALESGDTGPATAVAAVAAAAAGKRKRAAPDVGVMAAGERGTSIDFSNGEVAAQWGEAATVAGLPTAMKVRTTDKSPKPVLDASAVAYGHPAWFK